MDEWHLEQAARLEQALRDDALARNNAAMVAESHPDFDGGHCVECGIEIPEGRLALKKVRCTECQSRKERRR